MKHLHALTVLACGMSTLFMSALKSEYHNPVIPGFYPDPSICRVDSDYYLVNSSFQYFPAVPIWHSRDLVNWQQIGNVLSRESQVKLDNALSNGGIYAPTIRYNDGVFYMITTNVSSKGNFMVTATNPAGPWSEPIWLEQQGIDPSLYFEDGHCYMVSNPDNGIWLCEIDPTSGRQLSESKHIWDGTGGRYPEGPHIYKKDGWYYLMIAEGGTEYAHRMTISRSKSIYGPYQANPANPILTHMNCNAQYSPIQGTGHADLVEAPDGSWWMVCLAFRIQSGSHHLLGRETYLAPVTWEKDAWPVVNGDGTISLDMTADFDIAPKAQTAGSSLTKFNQKSLGPEWVYLRNRIADNFLLTGKTITLKATADDLDSAALPTFVGRRQQHHNFSADTRVTLHSTAANDQAGLSVFMDAKAHYDIYLASQSDGSTTINLRYRLGQLSHVENSIKINGNSATLKVSGTPDYYTFSYSTDDGHTFTPLGKIDARYLSSETVGGFTGIILGLYAIGAPTATATFPYFNYRAE